MITRLGVATALLVAVGSAHADVQVSKMKFAAPAHFQETSFADGKVVVDPKSDLKIVIFVVKKQGSLDDAAKAVTSDLAKSSLRLDGAAIKSVELGKAFDSESRGARQRWGKAKIDGKDAQFAILSRDKETIFLAGIASSSDGKGAFAKMVSQLESNEDVSSDASEKLPKLDTIIVLQDATASSTFVDKKKKDAYAPWQILDWDSVENAGMDVPPNAWCEGKPDEGIGENVTLTLAAPTRVDEMKIAAGVWLNQKLFDANNRITALSVSFDGGPAIKVSPSAKREWSTVKVGKPITTIKLTIDGVTKGKMNDSCISGVELSVGDDTPNIARGLDAAAMAALPAFYAALEKALADPARAGLDKLLAFPFTYESSDWFLDGSNRKPQKIANAKALATACKKKAPACPGLPNTGGREDNARLGGPGPGLLSIRFPSSREVIDVWQLAWKNGAWKLTSAAYESP